MSDPERIDGIIRFIERGIMPPFEEVQEVAAEVKRLRALIRDPAVAEETACTVCHATMDQEHAENCALAAWLAQHSTSPSPAPRS